jgi:site-specific recombinase XerD
MNNLITNIKNLELETIKNLKNSKSANTLRAYQSDYRDFSLFCSKNGFQVHADQPKILALYLTHLSSFSKYSTLKRRLASIAILHKTKGHYIDTKHPIIIENLMGIKRRNGTNQKGKKPILISDLKQIIEAIYQSNEKNNKKIRDKALILIGFSGGFRRSELVNIEYEDIDFVSEGVKIFIKKSKTDQSGEGMIKAIPYFDNQKFCPVIAIKNWIELN